MTDPTDAEIVALADATRTAEGSANGYILPISFARAVLAKWGMLRADRIVIPTDTMEQEFQKHYQRGYAAGQKASATQPTQAQAIPGVQWQCGPQANGFTAPQADSQPAPVRDYPPLPTFDSGDEPIWNAIFNWQTATPGPDAHRKANAIESAIIDQLRAYVDADRAAQESKSHGN